MGAFSITDALGELGQRGKVWRYNENGLYTGVSRPAVSLLPDLRLGKTTRRI